MRLTNLIGISTTKAEMNDDSGGLAAYYSAPISLEQAKGIGLHIGEQVACVVVPTKEGGFDGQGLQDIQKDLHEWLLDEPGHVYDLAMDLLIWYAARLTNKAEASAESSEDKPKD